MELNIATLEKLLGRPLTEKETQNFDLYIELATLQMLDLICLEALPTPLPADLALVIAQLFGAVSTRNRELVEGTNIASKKVEDFAISFRENEMTATDEVIHSNWNTILKYSKCQAEMRHGEPRYGCF